MFRKFAVILTAFITSFFLLASPVRAEGIFPNFNFNTGSQSTIYDAQEMLANIGDVINQTGNQVANSANQIGDVINQAGEIIEVVTLTGTVICVVGSVASTTVLPPAAAILPYCSAIGILDGGNAATKMINKPKKAWNVLSHVL